MKIIVIFTGGTIGSKVQNGWISTDQATKFELVENFSATSSEDVEFVCTEPYFALSENLSAAYLNKLISAYKEAENSDADGIIITHGTDSIQFSATALSLVSKNTKPTVMVSANYPLCDPRSNGADNFAAAVEFIKQQCGNGVFVSYKNPTGEHLFHQGHRMVAFLEGDDCLYSMNRHPFARYEQGKIVPTGVYDCRGSVLPCDLADPSGILAISALPSDPFAYNLEAVKAVIIKPYHSGTVATENEKFVEFCNHASKLNLPVFLANAPKSTTYDSAKLFRTLKITPLPDVTFSESYLRIWFGISRGDNLKNLF